MRMLTHFLTLGAVHETVNIRVRNTGGDPNTKGTHAYNLDKARTSLFSKQIMLLTSLRTDSSFSKFQIQVGGRFPQEDYEESVITPIYLNI